MRFKLDENLPVELLTDLREGGHEGETVHQEGLAGSPDPPLLDAARREGRVFLTMDKGVADVRAYPPERYAGLVLFRPGTSGRQTVLLFIRRHLPALLQADLAGHLLVVTERGIRVR